MTVLQLDVNVPDAHYPIIIGSALFADAAAQGVLADALSSEVLIVTNETIAPLYLDGMRATVRDSVGVDRVETLVLPDGEQFKTLETLQTIYTALLEAGYSRGCTLVALGGGVIGDMVGFAAATYQRGVDFVQVPTTLLAQVDSSVGGKTGVNHPLGKNMIGAFKQPEAVFIDTRTLETLPDRELSAGLAEVLKYGLIEDIRFLDWLEENWSSLLRRDESTLREAIARSCRIKADVVAEDEREQGRRAILNLGHTFGHAIETQTGYSEWLHGEAVATGMLMALDLSARLGWINGELQLRVEQLLTQAGLPTRTPGGMTAEAFMKLMARDKKVLSGQLRLVLLNRPGHAIVTSDFDPEALHQTLSHFQN